MRFMTDTTNPNTRFDNHIEYLEEETGKSLPMWTYASEELLELEYREVFLKTWQTVNMVFFFSLSPSIMSKSSTLLVLLSL